MMAVFVARYINRGARDRNVARAYVGYISHRAGRGGQPTHRQLWGEDGQVSHDQALSIVDNAKAGSWFYRLSIDPSPATEDVHRDLHLKTLTSKTLTQIQLQMATDVPWLASIHDDHTDKRHVHVLAITPRRMNRADLDAIRQAATVECRGQRLQLDAYRARRGAERDGLHEQRQHDVGRERVRRQRVEPDDQEKGWDGS
jgi:hypothetical protein